MCEKVYESECERQGEGLHMRGKLSVAMCVKRAIRVCEFKGVLEGVVRGRGRGRGRGW